MENGFYIGFFGLIHIKKIDDYIVLINAEYPYCNKVYLLPSMAMLKQLVFIWLATVSSNFGAMTLLRMQKALVFPQEYAFAIFESEKMFLNNCPKWSEVENG